MLLLGTFSPQTSQLVSIGRAAFAGSPESDSRFAAITGQRTCSIDRLSAAHFVAIVQPVKGGTKRRSSAVHRLPVSNGEGARSIR